MDSDRDKDRVSDDSSDESDDQRFEHEQHHLCIEEDVRSQGWAVVTRTG
jgi:hypothetical protein